MMKKLVIVCVLAIFAATANAEGRCGNGRNSYDCGTGPNGLAICCADKFCSNNCLQLEYPGEPVQECEVGYNWDILAEKCLLLPVCDTGFVLVGNVCVDDCQINGNCIDSICEKGQILSNGECIDESGEECEVGYIEINGSCVLKPECKAGAEWYRPCGDCGTQTKVCSSAGTWGGWGSCEVL